MPPANAASPSAAAAFAFDMAAVSHPGTERNDNEDACVTHRESDQCGLVAVADGVSSYEGGEVASQRATEVVVRFFKEQGPGVATMKRLVRAVQQANIEIYDTAVVVPQLRTMCTTLTALVLDRGEALAAHVGDSRLYLIREGQILQLTKDHTVAAERASASLGLMSKERLRNHPDRCVLTRSVDANSSWESIASRANWCRMMFSSCAAMACITPWTRASFREWWRIWMRRAVVARSSMPPTASAHSIT